jgi:hypothetical protein
MRRDDPWETQGSGIALTPLQIITGQINCYGLRKMTSNGDFMLHLPFQQSGVDMSSGYRTGFATAQTL